MGKKKNWLLLLPTLLLILALAGLFLSGPFQEGPWEVIPAIGGLKITLNETRYSARLTELTAVITEDDLPQLELFYDLHRADLRGSDCWEQIAAWADRHPEIEVEYSIPLPNGGSVDSLATSLDLRWMNTEQIPDTLRAVRCLKRLERVDLGDVDGSRLQLRDLSSLQEAFSGVALSYSAVVGAERIDGDARAVDLRALAPEDVPAVAALLADMHSLESVELGSKGETALSWSDIAQLKAARKDAAFHYSFNLYGQEHSLADETLDFRGVPVDDEGEALYSILPCMDHCRTLDMDSTGVSDEALAKLRDLFPQTEVIWRVWFGTNYSVRTDVERILASKPTVGGMIYDTTPLRYCTRVKYLDLGHNDEMSDLSFAMYMPDLEVLIIAMTGVSDLSPLTNCSKLEYLELNSSPYISDLSPLEGHTALRHLNIGCCPEIRDISPLYGISELERLWIGCETPVPAEQVAQMRQAAPGCKINTTTSDPHGEAWRFTRYDPEEPKYYWVPRHELLRNQLGYNYQEYSFYWLDPLCDLPAPPEHAGKYGKGVYGL